MEDKQLLSRMCESLKHRGPDRTDFYMDRSISLGVDRLSIIDLATGDQPIGNEDGSIQIVFNGEVYNYHELKSELEAAGHSFRTQSDTETIVHGYEEWGVSVLSHLRGMFAFAIWDSTKKKLFLARDRFGKKPLYYAHIDGIFFFASELKAILRYEYFPRVVDAQVLRQYLALLYIPSPSTIFRASRKLKPGHYLVFEKGEALVHDYWDLAFTPKMQNMSEDGVVDELYRLLLDAVAVRLRSDVPLGAFLSGGLDSSVVVSLMKRAGMDDVKTFTVGFHEAYYNELRDARRVADFIGTDHTERWAEPDVVSLLPRLVWHFDEPFGDSSLIPTYLVAKESRKEVTVALTGDGGDEIFAGYPFLMDPPIYRYYKRVPKQVRRAGLKLIGALPVQTRFTNLARRAAAVDYGGQDDKDRYALRVSHLGQDESKKLLLGGRLESESRGISELFYPHFARTSNLEDLDAFDYVTIKTYLPEDILTKVDRMTMAVSLEGRCPLLDHKLAEFVSHLPPGLKFQRGVLKSLLRRTAVRYDLVPKQTVTKPKHGFGAPIDYWLRNQWKEFASVILNPGRSKSVRHYFNETMVSKMLADPFSYREPLFSVMTFALWHEMYIEEPGNAPILQV
jgi:asparagine synthase (glutamine-hydrolysing)